MTPEESLACATSLLDEATENLTFEEFDWAFEEAWRGVAWVLNALVVSPQTMDLGPLGQVPDSGTLSALLAQVQKPPKEAERVVTQLEVQRNTARRSSDAEQVVFAAWDLHDACGRRLAIADDRLGNKLVLTDVAPGRVASSAMRRRTALKLIAAGSVLPLVACAKVERDNRTPGANSTPTVGEPTPTGASYASVRAVTPFSGPQWTTTDPFIFCAHHLDDYPAGNAALGPAAPLEGRQLGRDFAGRDNWNMYHGRTVPGFPRHPHRGFETVTFVRSGLLDHSDSMGATARYGDGDVQWLTAGGGIQHAEMFPLLRADSPNPLHLYQIWLNLPAVDKMVDPHFAMFWNENIPRVVEHDAAGRVVELTLAAGRYKAHEAPSPPPDSWASKADADIAIWTIRMEAGSAFELPEVSVGTKRSLYVHRGAGMRVAEQDVPADHRVEIDDHGPLVLLAGTEETEMLLLQGRPIGEPVARRGPFVMNTQAEIEQAYTDYRATQFGGWPWDANDPVHTREQGRFARHVDGRFEEPT